ncbi:MAG: M48 family metalloprotease [Patescibacteria group bacterium]
MYAQIDSNRHKTWILIAIFIGLIAAAGWVYGYVVTDSGPLGLEIALAISLGMTLISWFAGDKIALATNGAKELTDKSQFPMLWNVVENLAITAGLPMPRVYIVNDPSPNAFATGRDPKHASIAVTTGLLQIMDRTELEGVISHEMSHIKNLDSRVMMIVIVLVGTLTIIGDSFLRFGLIGGRGRGRRNDGGLGIVFLLVGLAFLILSPFIGQLIKLAISRKREYLADASGALLTRYPEGLASALKKIETANVPMKHVSGATNHLWISEPTSRDFRSRISGLFSTHPPIEDRIKRLVAMEDNR